MATIMNQSATSPSTPATDIVKQLELQFVDMLHQFITALVEVFPECSGIKKYHDLFHEKYLNVDQHKRDVVAGVLIRKYHQEASPSFPMCAQKDNRVFAGEHEVLRDVQLYEKFQNGLHETTAENIWKFVNKLNEFSRLHDIYSKVPTNMMKSLETLATELSSTIQDPSDLQNIDFQQLGSKIMSTIRSEDMQNFSNNMQSGGLNDINGMFSMLQTMLQE
jgi:hypothetical protein